MNLAAILDPYTEETFFSTFWERRPLHIARARPGYFRELLTLEGMNEVLSQLVFRADECKVAREGQIIPPSVYLAAPSMRIMERTATDYVSSVRLLALFTQGATLVFSQLNHKWQPLERLRRELQRQLSAAVVTNVFLSNRDSQGFSVHYDSHDVLVLQLHGRKIWQLYDDPIELPLKSQAFGHTTVAHGPLRAEIDLGAGDVLYLPRGYFHEARTVEEVSLHLTLGIHPYLWSDYLGDLLHAASRRSVALRRSVPADFLALSEEQRQQHLMHALSVLSSATDSQDSVYKQALGNKLEAGTYYTPDHLQAILAGETR